MTINDSVVFQTFILVGAAELFDKTFFITMILAMKHKSFIAAVLVGCYAALVVHTAMAAALGYGISKIPFLSKMNLDFASAALYLLFAVLYANDWRKGSRDSLGAMEEAQETLGVGPSEAAQAEAAQSEAAEARVATGVAQAGATQATAAQAAAVEAGLAQAGAAQAGAAQAGAPQAGAPQGEAAQEEAAHADLEGCDRREARKSSIARVFRILCIGFTSTFIAEFGDRTQFAMISQHASQPLIPVCIGSVIAFFVLCCVAVACGACLSRLAISERNVALIGGISFFIFFLVSLHNGLSYIYKNPFYFFFSHSSVNDVSSLLPEVFFHKAVSGTNQLRSSEGSLFLRIFQNL